MMHDGGRWGLYPSAHKPDNFAEAAAAEVGSTQEVETDDHHSDQHGTTADDSEKADPCRN